ncbi:MAG: hypothetical protein J5956_14095 [Ruminococcus sp.]|nr:hypothetical protein [Ruminococcus sp.]
MKRITVRIDDELAEMVEKSLKTDGYTSLNQLINELLKHYAVTHNRLFVQMLPAVVESICKEHLDEIQKENRIIFRTNERNSETIMKKLSEIYALFLPEIS